eukprot:NODE_2505_length_1184_cov_26.789427_g2287_i0.p1 GENE.NODE_2505_length_1184_cov_26.789427_g2287_i0~~NODE_2505_length_1184_cov_26.789427_g2287_i0.p1  ORF type:complete len:257 (-),score=38.59 NODE_2505_length_1184_cov_26.789427_g2287_i0:309-1079(-)
MATKTMSTTKIALPIPPASACEDPGVQEHLRRVGLTTAASLAVTGLSATAFGSGLLPLPQRSLGMLLLTASAVVGSTSAIVFIQPERAVDEEGNVITKNPKRRVAAHQILNIAMGSAMSPLLMSLSPHSLFAAATITGGMAAGLAAFSLTRPTQNLRPWTPVLFAGLGAITLVQVGGAVVLLVHPSIGMVNVISWLDVLVGVPLFSGFVYYDINKAIYQYAVLGHADHLMHSVSIYLDLINLFLRVAEASHRVQRN